MLLPVEASRLIVKSVKALSLLILTLPPVVNVRSGVLNSTVFKLPIPTPLSIVRFSSATAAAESTAEPLPLILSVAVIEITPVPASMFWAIVTRPLLLKFTSPLLLLMAALISISPPPLTVSAFNTTCSLWSPPFSPDASIAALIKISLALSVNVLSAARLSVGAIESTTTILAVPVPEPVATALTVTSFVVSANSIVAVRSRESSTVSTGVNGLPLKSALISVVTMPAAVALA